MHKKIIIKSVSWLKWYAIDVEAGGFILCNLQTKSK